MLTAKLLPLAYAGFRCSPGFGALGAHTDLQRELDSRVEELEGRMGAVELGGREAQRQIAELREALATGNVAFSAEFFSSTGIAEAKQQLEQEMRAFAVITEAPKTPFGKVKRTYTGKTGCAPVATTERDACAHPSTHVACVRSGRNDDIVITLQLALAGARMFYQSDRYRQFRGQPTGHATNHSTSVL